MPIFLYLSCFYDIISMYQSDLNKKQEVNIMITFIALFYGCYCILAMFLDAIVLESSAVMTFLALATLCCGALAIFAHVRQAWTPAILCLFGMVAIELLAQHIAMVEILSAVMLAIIATYHIKREISTIIRRDAGRPGGPTIPHWIQLLLRYA